jgi:multiple sugar transport system permease protein
MASVASVHPQATIRHRVRVDWRAAILLAVLGGGALVMFAPFALMFAAALQPGTDFYDLPPAFVPIHFTLDNVRAAVTGPAPMPAFFINSLKIAIAVTIGQLATCSLAGYAFAQLRFPGRNLLFALLLSALMIPVQVTIIPTFVLMRALGLIDNHLSLILPNLSSALGIFLMRQFFLGLPRELMDAARIDGAGHLRTFWAIALPLAGPSVAALTVIAFLGSWNSLFAPLVFLSTYDHFTLPLGIVQSQDPLSFVGPAVPLAAAMLAVVPMLLVFLVAQRWIVAGLARSGIKG